MTVMIRSFGMTAMPMPFYKGPFGLTAKIRSFWCESSDQAFLYDNNDIELLV